MRCGSDPVLRGRCRDVAVERNARVFPMRALLDLHHLHASGRRARTYVPDRSRVRLYVSDHVVIARLARRRDVLARKDLLQTALLNEARTALVLARSTGRTAVPLRNLATCLRKSFAATSYGSSAVLFALFTITLNSCAVSVVVTELSARPSASVQRIMIFMSQCTHAS